VTYCSSNGIVTWTQLEHNWKRLPRRISCCHVGDGDMLWCGAWYNEVAAIVPVALWLAWECPCAGSIMPKLKSSRDTAQTPKPGFSGLIAMDIKEGPVRNPRNRNGIVPRPQIGQNN
jgi:hypothetical protein